MKRRAVAAISTLGGALEKTLEALKPYLPGAPEPGPAFHAQQPKQMSAEHAA
jgi:hypothetical protein